MSGLVLLPFAILSTIALIRIAIHLEGILAALKDKEPKP